MHRPGLAAGSVDREATVHTLQLLPSNPDHLLVGVKSSQAFVMTVQGQLLRSFSSGKQTGGDFLCATLSPQGNVMCVSSIYSNWKQLKLKTFINILVSILLFLILLYRVCFYNR